MAEHYAVPAHPGSSSASASRRMSNVLRRDTGPELSLRKELHARGLRYRVDYPVPNVRRRSIDIAFTRWKVAVFVDGCFWHGCAEHLDPPKTNSEWWSMKIEANRARDRDTDLVLWSQGWEVLRFWEHVLPQEAASAVAIALSSRRHQS